MKNMFVDFNCRSSGSFPKRADLPLALDWQAFLRPCILRTFQDNRHIKNSVLTFRIEDIVSTGNVSASKYL